jgi:hypothetical protein
MSSQELKKLTRDPVFSGAAIFVTIVVVGLIWLPGWQSLFAILISWIMADAIINIIFKGERGIFQVVFLGTSTQPKGYAYLAFAIAIVFTTLVSTGLSQYMASIVNNLPSMVFGSFFATLLVWSDLQLRFYRKK